MLDFKKQVSVNYVCMLPENKIYYRIEVDEDIQEKHAVYRGGTNLSPVLVCCVRSLKEAKLAAERDYDEWLAGET